MLNRNSTRVESEVQYDPRLAGEILHDYLENSNEPLAVAFREKKQKLTPTSFSGISTRIRSWALTSN